jgi:hypothetical protein
MSNRTLVEINHDYCPNDDELLRWAQAIRTYIRSGDKRFLPHGITFVHMRHHSQPDPVADLGDPR